MENVSRMTNKLIKQAKTLRKEKYTITQCYENTRKRQQKDWVGETNQKYRKKKPDSIDTRIAVSNAIETGSYKKQKKKPRKSIQVCGEISNTKDQSEILHFLNKVWRLLYLCSEVTLSWNVGEYVQRTYRTTQALNILRN